MKYRVLLLEPDLYFEELGVLDEFKSSFLISRGFFNLGILSRKLQRNRYDAVITCISHSASSRYITYMAQNCDVPVFYFMDGIGDFSNFQLNSYALSAGVSQMLPNFHDFVFCVDDGTKNFIHMQGAGAECYKPSRVYGKTMIDNSKSEFDFLITTANTPYFNDFELSQLAHLINNIIASISSSGKTFAVRLYDKQLMSLINDCETNLTLGVFDDAMCRASCLITTPSSIVMPTVMSGIPVAILDYRDAPLLLQTGWRIHSSVDLPTVLNSMLDNNEDRMLYQNSTMEMVFESNVGAAIKGEIERRKSINDFSTINNLKSSVFTFSVEYYARYVLKKIKKLSIFSTVIKYVKSKGIF
jgi:hypothetical protein